MSTESIVKVKKVTTSTFIKMKADKVPITMLTAYDYPTAMYLDQAGIDAVLVGDSLAMVELGYEDTLAATMDMMVHHTKAVRKGVSRALLISDMPFLSYQISVERAVENAGRLVQEGGADAVKLEGGAAIAEAVKAVIDAGIPVMGHLGLTPQSYRKFGGYGLQADSSESAAELLDDAMLLEELGCFSVVLEKIPSELAALVGENLTIPTIGIGAGASCDGQVLVTHDMIGLFERFKPKFVKQYMQLGPMLREAFQEYIGDVRSGKFSLEDHSYHMDAKEFERVKETADDIIEF